jgi:hypothetical protein
MRAFIFDISSRDILFILEGSRQYIMGEIAFTLMRNIYNVGLSFDDYRLDVTTDTKTLVEQVEGEEE